jgi:parallel beta-helix repeat protein
MLLKPGFLIQSRYLIIRQLAQSSIGAMYEAVDKRTRQRVALKQVRASYTSGNAARLRETFDHTATMLLRLSHNALPPMLDYFADPAGQFLVMEFVPGDDLWAQMQQQPGNALPLRDVLRWADQVLDLLDYLHTQREPLIHRDIKPHNLKLNSQGNMMLLDIGLVDGSSVDTLINGHSSYMLQYVPPEQLHGDVRDPRSDLFALGATLYALLSGTPFSCSLDRALALSLGEPDPLQPLDQLNPHVPPDIAAVIQRAMAHQPEQRFASATEMRAALSAQRVSHTLVVHPNSSNPDDYPTISAALAVARPHARILVQPGYYTESLRIDRPLSLIGDGPAEQIIIESTDAPCLQLTADRAEVRGLTLRARSVAPAQPFYAVEIGQGAPLLEACAITSESLACIGIHGAHATPTIRRCTLHDGAQTGIDVYDQAGGLIESCEIFGNTRAGIEVSQHSRPTIRHCVVRNGHAGGIYLDSESRATVEDCQIFENARSGIAICMHSEPTIRHCTIRQNGGAGIFLYKNGHGTIETCTITGNTAAGIEIKDQSDPTIQRCTISNGLSSGLYVHNQGAGSIEQCDIFGHADPCVIITTNGTPTLRACHIYHGRQEGLWVARGGTGRIEQCEIYSNARPNIVIHQGGNPHIQHSQIRNGKDIGIRVIEQGNGQIEDCTITGHARCGVLLEQRATLTLLRCRVQRNGSSGIAVQKNSSGLIQTCDLRDNRHGSWHSEGRHSVRSVENVE